MRICDKRVMYNPFTLQMIYLSSLWLFLLANEGGEKGVSSLFLFCYY